MNTCKDCKYWISLRHPDECDPVYQPGEQVFPNQGDCHRYAPHIDFPQTYENDWCGEFSSRTAPIVDDSSNAVQVLTLLKEEVQTSVALFDKLSAEHKANKDVIGRRHYVLCAAIFSSLTSAILRAIMKMEFKEPVTYHTYGESWYREFRPDDHYAGYFLDHG